jgi:hypothetical protein
LPFIINFVTLNYPLFCSYASSECMTFTIFLTLAQDYGRDFFLEFLVELGWLLIKNPLIARKFLNCLVVQNVVKLNIHLLVTKMKTSMINSKIIFKLF